MWDDVRRPASDPPAARATAPRAPHTCLVSRVHVPAARLLRAAPGAILKIFTIAWNSESERCGEGVTVFALLSTDSASFLFRQLRAFEAVPQDGKLNDSLTRTLKLHG